MTTDPTPLHVKQLASKEHIQLQNLPLCLVVRDCCPHRHLRRFALLFFNPPTNLWSIDSMCVTHSTLFQELLCLLDGIVVLGTIQSIPAIDQLLDNNCVVGSDINKVNYLHTFQ